jgi:hypothetical protein
MTELSGSPAALGGGAEVMRRPADAVHQFCVVALTGVLCFGLSRTAQAEMDYEFVKALIERHEPSFPTDDLVVRQIALMEADTLSKTDAKLALATYRRKQAESASPETRTKLLNEADQLYKDILAGDKKHRLYAIAEKDAGTIVNARIKATIRAAKDLEKSDPAKAREMRSAAAKQMADIAATHKAEADTKIGPFNEMFKKYKDWNEKSNPEGDKPIPRDIMEGLDKTFDPWVVADKRYLHAKVEQLECLDDSDPAKKPLAEELAKYCDAALTNEAIEGFVVLTAWYSFQHGRIYSLIGDETKAAEAWGTALAVDPGNLGDEQKRQVFMLQRGILHDVVKMLMKGKKYAEVENAIVDAQINPNLKSLFEEDSGKDLMIDYAKALTLPADAGGAAEYEKALKKLRDLIEIETRKGSPTWANNFSRTMAEILVDARKKGVRPRLAAEEWYSAAYGFFVLGQNEWQKFDELNKANKDAVGAEAEKIKAQFEVAYEHFENAVDYYRRAIGVARSDRTELFTRLEIEPKSWFQMGLCYLKMKHFYEAVIVYKAMRTTYLPEYRKRWMPDPVKDKKFYSKEVVALLEELDKPKDGLLAKSGSNIVFGLDQNAAIHADLWNSRLKADVLRDPTAQPEPGEGITDTDYLAARADMDWAKAYTERAKNIADKKEVEKTYREVADKYVVAAQNFAKVKPTSVAYEIALYQTATCFTMAQEIWFSGKLGSSAEQKKQSKDLAVKALESFQKYNDFVTKAEAGPSKETEAEKIQEEKDRRAKLRGAMLLARNSLYSGTEEWEKSVSSSDEYISWEQRQPNLAKSSIDIALLNKFRGLVELAANTPDGNPRIAPDCDSFINGADVVMKEIVKRKPNDKKLHQFMYDAVSRRNAIAAFQLEKAVQDNLKKADGAKDKLTEAQLKDYETRINGYWDKVTELHGARVKMAEEDPNEKPSLEDYCRLVNLYDRAQRYREAADTSHKLLDIFDAGKNNLRILDDVKIWRPLEIKLVGDRVASSSQGIIVYQDFTKMKRCWDDHTMLLDYMYDTPEGVNASDQKNRPAWDRYNVDMEKALVQLETMKKNYPDAYSLPDKVTRQPIPAAKKAVAEWIEESKKYLEELMKNDAENAGRYKVLIENMNEMKDKAVLTIIEEEIDYRRKIMAVRDKLSKLAMDVSQQLKDEAEVRKYREMASEQIKILLKARGDTPAGQMLAAELDVLNGKYEEALDMLWKIKNNADKESMVYFDASRKISEVNAKQAEASGKQEQWQNAAEFPTFIAITAGLDSKKVKENWPTMREFLKQCAEKGVKLPQAVVDKLKDDVKPAPGDVKPDEKKDAPADQKPTEPAAQDAAPKTEKKE